MKKVMVFGTFDILHKGHIHMLKEAKEYGDFLIVIVARDKTVCKVKGNCPKNNEVIRLKNIRNLKLANKIKLGHIENKYKVLKEEKPDIVALGYDQKVFVENLTNAVSSTTKIVKLQPYMPDIYKSSKLS